MCGIVGVASKYFSPTITQGDFKKMNDLISHRGPDDDGFYFGHQAFLGMRRLSIIDLDSGKQPIYNEDYSIVVVCNGEIYNYIELREQLISLGHTFRTKSDTEVIVHLYEEFGMQMLSKINGMFGFAIWDSKHNKLIVARDRLGKKPLYYTLQENDLVFGSEIKSILSYPGFNRDVDKSALMNLLTFNYVPTPKTLFKGIMKLPPGTYLTFENGELELCTYWELDNEEEKLNLNEQQAMENLEELLIDAVKLRLRSDVPVGAFLSGGVDSSTIVALMSRLTDEQFKTFSIGFEEEAYNELPFAEQVAQLYNTDHITEIVKSQSFDLLSEVIWYTDNPHGDVSFLPTLQLSRLASRSVKVALTGDGADELFAGYEKYDNVMNLRGTDFERWNEYHDLTSVFNRQIRDSLVSQQLKSVDDSGTIVQDAYQKMNGDLLNRILHFDMYYLLEGNNLVKPDRMAMAVGVETRSPFLDFRVVDFVSKLPTSFKWNMGSKKYLLKKLMHNKLPDEILYREKQMFTVPIGEWIKKDLKELFRLVLLGPTFKNRGYFDMHLIRNMLEEHIAGRKNYTRQLRLLLIVELWHRIFIDRDTLKVPSFDEIIEQLKREYV